MDFLNEGIHINTNKNLNFFCEKLIITLHMLKMSRLSLKLIFWISSLSFYHVLGTYPYIDPSTKAYQLIIILHDSEKGLEIMFKKNLTRNISSEYDLG